MNPWILIGLAIAALLYFRKKSIDTPGSGSSVQTGDGNSGGTSGGNAGTTGGNTGNSGTGSGSGSGSGGGEVSTEFIIGESIANSPNYGVIVVTIPLHVKNTGTRSIYVDKGELNSTARYIYDPTVVNRVMTQIKPYTAAKQIGIDIAPGETKSIGFMTFELRGENYLFSSVIGKNQGTIYFDGTGVFLVSGQIKNVTFSSVFRT
ncbi:hypothetical protein [Siphonobacter aquaeclarae]|uniref:Uncharacterized protein n=1 Tax=Siphonobacter aquaeclarae TaxID=563176 RepID=A0A1G9T9D1_9BACT|nr:hypothetical protein [Siphonobacter aquaeclarae]SDM44250.1 hypothetical protein SAMN04488090_3467 [Siphonobacter aquaeclarae]